MKKAAGIMAARSRMVSIMSKAARSVIVSIMYMSIQEP